MRVLIAEDDPVSRHMLEAFLTKWGYEVVVAGDGQEAWQVLQQDDAPKLAILDWMMPGMEGVQVCRRLRERADHPYVYVLMLTSRDRKQDLVEGIEAGADDYLIKPFDAHELRAHLHAGKRILDLQQELISARDALRVQATHDPLTGLWNHAAIFDILRRELERAQRQRTSLGVVMADLDHFKQINDTYGHPAGDAVLREATRRMQSAVRTYDSIGRYGGEEFLIVVPGADEASALHQGERLRASISKAPIEVDPSSAIPLTISLGVTAPAEPKASNLESLLRAADLALYEAKRKGRNRVEMAKVERVVDDDLHVSAGPTP